MPRAKKAPRNTPDFDFKGFVTVNLTADDIARIEAEEVDQGRLFDHLSSLLDKGYKFSCKIDPASGSVAATLMDVDPSRPAFGFGLSGWGGDLADAVQALLYKHFFLCQDGWPTELAGRPVTRFR